MALGVAGQSLLAGLQELLRPLMVEALGNAFTPAQFGDGVFASKPLQDYASAPSTVFIVAAQSAKR